MPIDDVADLTPRVQYTAAAAQDEFDYDFPIFEEEDLVVYVDGALQALDTDYTVDGEGNDAGGSITFLTPLDGGEVVTIYRDIPIQRTSDYQQNGPWSSDDTNEELNRIIMMMQQLEAGVDRSLRLSMLDTTSDMVLPLAEDRLGTIPYFNDVTGELEMLALADISGVSTALTASLIGQTIYPRTAQEIAEGVTPTYYQYEHGRSARYGETDEDNFGGKFTAMYGLTPYGGNPYSFGGFVLNTVNGRLNLGTNWTSPTGSGRQVHHNGYATLMQFDENGDIAIYTRKPVTMQGDEFQSKYTHVWRASGTQWVNSNGAGQSWAQLISTAADTDLQGYGTDRLHWGCVETAADIVATSETGDVAYAIADVDKAFRWNTGLVMRKTGLSLQYASGNQVYSFAPGGTGKGAVGMADAADQLITGSAQYDICMYSVNKKIMLSNDGGVTADAYLDAGAIYNPSMPTTASAANVFVDNAASNKLMRSTSSIRYKTDVRTLEDSDLINRLRPVLYRSLCEGDNPDVDWFGLIAEEVAEVAPRLVSYGEGGRVESVQYDRLVVPLIAKVQQLEARLAAANL